MKKWITALLLALIIGVGIYFTVAIRPKLPIATGYAARCACTNYFAANRALQSIKAEDLGATPLSYVGLTPDPTQKTMRASLLGESKTAIYKPGYGCILLKGQDDYNIDFPKKMGGLTVTVPIDPLDNEPAVITKPSQLEAALSEALKPEYQTSAIAILKGNQVVATRYKDGVDEKTPILGWSMTKSICNALIGIMVRDRIIDIDQDNLFEEWANDERRHITLRNLLQMNSGLQWDERYDQVTDATKMLFDTEQCGLASMTQPLMNKPGTTWNYSSGTTNLISLFIRRTIGNDSKYWQLAQEELFKPLMMSSAFIESDESGTMILSSYGYADALDWAKFGLLYLRDGELSGKRILPEGWVDFTRKVSNGSGGVYGAQWWLNTDRKAFPDAPEDLFYANGYQGQHVFVIPSADVVIVRLGLNDAWPSNTFIKEVLASL